MYEILSLKEETANNEAREEALRQSGRHVAGTTHAGKSQQRLGYQRQDSRRAGQALGFEVKDTKTDLPGN